MIYWLHRHTPEKVAGADMSISQQRARDLVSAYDRSLEQQIVGRGSGLACSDVELWKQVEVLLRDADAQETHCLGLDPLRVMEESLKAAAALSAPAAARGGGGRVKARGRLHGLAKAFEVLEQAALNLYLGPWREEYKVIKVYSGMFTHYITPVLSVPQTEKLFGLLGYQSNSSRPEQLRLQSPRVGGASLDDLLRLSCAFFMARCECHLLLTALGKHVGDAQWELSVVKERQRGSSLQVALDNTKKTLEVKQPQMEAFDEVDLYRDEQVNGGQREVVISDDEGLRSLTWATQSSASPPAVKTHSNGAAPSSSLLESDTARSSSASKRQGRCSRGEPRFDQTDLQSFSLQAEAMAPAKNKPQASRFCSCLHSPHLCLNRCLECNTLHDITCASVEVCKVSGHRLEFVDRITEDMKASGAPSPQSGGLRANALPTLTSSSAAMSSLALCDNPKSISPSLQPITYHDCCDLAKLDPQVLCRSCNVFHSVSCIEKDVCQMKHDVTALGVCVCGRRCPRKPLVLCRYCGNEYCNNCWYRNPLKCSCGQTFDQSSSV